MQQSNRPDPVLLDGKFFSSISDFKLAIYPKQFILQKSPEMLVPHCKF